MSREPWQTDDSDDFDELGTATPDGLDAAGRAWFRRHIAARAATVMAHLERRGALPRAGEWEEAVVEWFLERWRDYLAWVDFDTYRGRAYANGEWKLREDAITRDLPLAFGTTAPAFGFVYTRNGKPYPPPPAVPPGPIDVDAALAALKAPGVRGAREPHVRDVLPYEAAWRRWCRSHDRTVMHRECTVCRQAFTQRRRDKYAACPDCRAAKRRRCRTCDGLFTDAATGRKRQCPACTAAAPAARSQPSPGADARARRRP